MVRNTVGSDRCSPITAMSIQRCDAQALALRIGSVHWTGGIQLTNSDRVQVTHEATMPRKNLRYQEEPALLGTNLT